MTRVGNIDRLPPPMREPLRSQWPSRPGGPHESSRWEARAGGRTHRFAVTSNRTPRQGRMEGAVIVSSGSSFSRPCFERRASLVTRDSDGHAPLRGAVHLELQPGGCTRWRGLPTGYFHWSLRDPVPSPSVPLRENQIK